MDDLKERLRKYAPAVTKPRVAAVMEEAADRIEALEAQLAKRDAEIENIIRGDVHFAMLEAGAYKESE